MGFAFDVDNSGHVRITLESADQVRTSFVQAVESCLKRRIVLFTIDVQKSPPVLREIWGTLQALHKVLKPRGFPVRVEVGRSQDLVTAHWREVLRTHGFVVNISGPAPEARPAVPPAVVSVVEPASVYEIDFASLLKAVAAGEPPDLESTFAKVAAELERVVVEEKRLRDELSFYQGQLTVLQAAVPSAEERDKLQERMREEALHLRRLQSEAADLKSALQVAEAELRLEEENHQHWLRTHEGSVNAQLISLQAELQDILAAQERMQRLFDEQSQARLQEMARLQAQ